MIEKEILNTGLISHFTTVILRDNEKKEECILSAPDYSFFRNDEGMNDQEIMNFSGDHYEN